MRIDKDCALRLRTYKDWTLRLHTYKGCTLWLHTYKNCTFRLHTYKDWTLRLHTYKDCTLRLHTYKDCILGPQGHWQRPQNKTAHWQRRDAEKNPLTLIPPTPPHPTNPRVRTMRDWVQFMLNPQKLIGPPQIHQRKACIDRQTERELTVDMPRRPEVPREKPVSIDKRWENLQLICPEDQRSPEKSLYR